jgi:GMP synthase-like glutamine amidotransferase
MTDYGEPNRQDPAWFTSSSPTWVADVNHDGRTVNIYCVGQMRLAHLPSGSVLRNADDLAEFGITNDEELAKTDGSPDLWEWINNSWFELFEGEDSTGVVAHSLKDAVDLARHELTEVRL